jgi:hypothetical protein
VRGADAAGHALLIAALYDERGHFAGFSVAGMSAWTAGAATYFLAGSIGGTLPAFVVSVVVYSVMSAAAAGHRPS